MANQVYRVRGVGSLGLIKDTPPFENPSPAWTNVNNVRFRKSSLEKMGGYFPVHNDTLPTTPPLVVFQRGFTPDTIYATGTQIYMIQGKDHLPVGKAGMVYNANSMYPWRYCTLSNAVVLVNEVDVPQGLLPHEGEFKDLPGWGQPQGPDGPTATWRCKNIRSYRNYLFALHMIENGFEYPQRIRWSNVAYVNSLPADWIENDPAKDGGFNDLSDCTGSLLDAVPLRDSLVVYTDQETYLIDYIGGDLVFSFKKLFSDSGVIAPRCAVEFEGKHFVISQNDIFIHNGSTRQPVASGRVKDFLIEEISSVNPLATKVVALPHMKEIWICYAAPGQSEIVDRITNVWEDRDAWVDDNTWEDYYTEGEASWVCTRAAIWNWEYDTWSLYDLPRLNDINCLLPPSMDVRIWADYVNENYHEWDDIAQQEVMWSELGRDFVKKILWGASADRTLYILDEGPVCKTVNRGTGEVVSRPLASFMERTNLDLDDAVEYTRMYKFVKEVIPQFEGVGTLYIRMGGSPTASGNTTWDDYQVFDIEEDDKVDFYSNHRYPSIRFEDFGEGDWKLSGYDMIFSTGGYR